MTFFDRYAAIAEKRNLDPCSQKAADLFGVTRAAISTWGSKKTTPNGETVATMADRLEVSTDYLLGRTDDPTDYAKGRPGMTDYHPKTVQYKAPSSSDPLLILVSKLDQSDRLRIEGVIQGMLMQDKYLPAQMPNAAHIRTDISVTSDMIEHDEEVMDDENF